MVRIEVDDVAVCEITREEEVEDIYNRGRVFARSTEDTDGVSYRCMRVLWVG